MGRFFQSPCGQSPFRVLVTGMVVLFANLLVGCFSQNEDRQAGVDDFPNSIYARVQGHLGEAEQGETVVIPAEALAVIHNSATSSSANTLPKQAALHKGASVMANATGTFTTIKSGQGDSAFVFYASTKIESGKVQIDTLFFKPGTSLLDSAQWITGLVSAKHIEADTVDKIDGTLRGRVALAIFSDGDGDGLMSLPLGSARVKVHLETREGGVTEVADLITDGGPDGNLDTEADNRIYQARSLRLRGTDTLATAVYSDANGDGIVIDNGKPTAVDLLFYERDPKDKLEVAERTLSLRLVSHYTPKGQMQTQQPELLRFAAVETLRNGQINRLAYSNADGGDDLNPQGRTRVSLAVENTPSRDTLESMAAISVVQPETVFGQDRDSVLSYAIQTHKRLGEEKAAHFAFTTTKPAPPKTDPRNGQITLAIDYRDETQVTVEGTLKDGAFSALITARDGTLYDATWDADGKLVRIQVTK
jgi:hypothetical protein